MQTGLSIIVPVYNAEPRLRKCIDSILAQTMRDYELILVDDGSTDASGAVCDEYAKEDHRVTVLHIRNRGPALARNEALSAAAGKYIGFVDADDWIEPGMYQRMLDTATETGADLVICDYVAETAAGSIKEVSMSDTGATYDRNGIETLFLPYFFGYTDKELKDYKGHCPFADYHSYLWLGIYKAEVIKACGMTIPDDRLYFNEDNLFNLSFVYRANRITHVPEHFYHYLYNQFSFTKKFDKRYWKMKSNKIRYLADFIAGHGLGAEYSQRLRNKTCLDCVSVINYYAGSRFITMKERREWVKTVAVSAEMSSAMKTFPMKALPFSKTKIFLRLCALGAYRLIAYTATLYRRTEGNRNL